ncbi:hypothetical protein DMN91_006137 [Ooceraea biroi]|uniref:Odorant receptor n=1 Tax=Ooceraea biroi TaxID=2015173 RepID=A0A026WIK7_OOCBI|nr:uncharacterized protein LOC105279110 isoform X2 [Ooceraea biroi]EZA55491.1 hypothetical protein X777_04285 [Ooceraea biroi]RLU21761.1 hypothetical protein DMN91_006137 [Ooceraea biroi]
MICIKTKYFNLNRILLLAVGLWPYQQSRLVQLFVFNSLLNSIIIFQLLSFLTAECTPDFIITVLSSVSVYFVSIIQYNSFWSNISTIRYLLDQLQDIYNKLKDENEIAIMETYGRNAKRLTANISLLTMGSIVIFLSLPIWVRIIDIFLILNNSQHGMIQLTTEYFIDQEKYFYLILLHIDAATCIAGSGLTAIGLIYCAYFKHICGMFRIASYRIKQAITLEKIFLENDLMIYKEMIYAIDMHRKAMKFSEDLLNSIEGSVFLSIISSVCCLSLNLFGIVWTTSTDFNIQKVVIHFGVVLMIVICMFLANSTGQEITDHNNHVFTTVYNTEWYIAPLQTQKLILFLLQRNNKPFILNIRGIVISSMECFTKLMKASISYFTVIYSIH